MERNIYEIELEIPNSGIFIMGLENENLIISLNIMKFIEINAEKIATLDGKLDVGGLAKPLHSYIIYEVLEKNNKNNFNDVKIIDKIEDENNIIYHFNFGLILNTFIGENEDNKDKEALKTLSFMQNFIPACFFSYQIIGDSKAIPKNVLEDLKNRYGYEGKNYKSIFKKEVYINCNCLERLNFSHCEFESKVSLRFLKDNKYKEFHNGIDFSNCIFKNEVDFSYFVSGAPLPDNKYYNNAQNTLFKDCIFENKVDFHNSKITNNIYFNNAHFKDYVDFHECEFEKTVNFYGVIFEKAPNFSACYFKEPKAVNLINVDIDKLDFKSLEQYIKDKYQDETYENKQELTEEQRNNNCKLKCAKHLKDSFRVIKDILITQNNTLEAQEWHKLELYAKEKELLFEVESCYKEKNKPFIAAKSEDKNSINLTFSVLLLWIYRVTSLHHTNLPRIINFASLNIVAFGGLVCLITYLSYHINKQSNFWLFGVLILFALIIGIVSLLLKKQKLKNITLILCLFLAFLLALFLMQRIAFLSSFGDIIFALLFYCLLVIVLIYLYPYINLKSFISYCFNWLVYFFLVMIVVIKPQLINPFAGIFSSDKLYESQFEKSLNDLNVSAIMILTDISQDNFNLPSKDQNISFVELNSAKALIIANKEKLKEILSKVYNDKYVSDYKKVLNELENNTSNVKNIIEEIDNKNNNSVISVQLNQILNFNFSQEIDVLYMIKSNFFISEKLSPEQMAIFDQKDSQDKLKSVLALLKFKSSFEGILKIINQDEITENTIKSTSVLYSIMLLLCIFSLQKTARKNSIVPS
ncbi:pentapeptide repeat-containing protein [Campylobacter jejuni]|uniref:pentapeptide repeat-containing protein n=1 Tax=Campylobacter jejuni TaxID=197 RepID=UPI001F096D75|nr:pentapeptide repeat-containing protein [Campylobacter jejuni]MCH3777766.1 pentapeptide repeat-containing protein [Campylobacter jejuni]MCH3788043.1 pentapeptide repeat-containing protein [Campylobacter jejuni]MCH3793269.1 pentapeptide repeat-containing protein [Campylobacter jejuni]MCH3796350.1 pentapeptide repeat-containing protein [Campylobacter jejuni]MCH3798561.1 pentapeptide repeat-containing protein [Campylobacter jejuni]